MNEKSSLGGSKRYSVADEVSIKATREGDDWGVFDEDWGFKIWDIPKEFRTEKKFENFNLAKKEEKEGKLVLEFISFSVSKKIDFFSINLIEYPNY